MSQATVRVEVRVRREGQIKLEKISHVKKEKQKKLHHKLIKEGMDFGKATIFIKIWLIASVTSNMF